MKQEELNEIIRLHGMWLRNEDGGARANLSRIDLRRCNLSGSNLSGSNLSGSDLSGCNLSGSDLSGCNLSGCDLSACDLRGCNLSGSDLSGSDLSGSDLSGSNLRGSDLSGCDLSGSNLRRCDLRGIKEDFFKILSTSIPEIEGLKLALIESRVNGSTYTGECCCLVGTIANLKHCKYEKLEHDSNRPAERWFLAINEYCSIKHPVVEITLEWIEEFKKLNNL